MPWAGALTPPPGPLATVPALQDEVVPLTTMPPPVAPPPEAKGWILVPRVGMRDQSAVSSPPIDDRPGARPAPGCLLP